MAEFYIDTNIWIDIIEDRKGFKKEPLGIYGIKFLRKIMRDKDIILLSDVVYKELLEYYPVEKINMMNSFIKQHSRKINCTREQIRLGRKISRERRVPIADVLHALIAKDHKAILITRDKHFKRLRDIIASKKPEELKI